MGRLDNNKGPRPPGTDDKTDDAVTNRQHPADDAHDSDQRPQGQRPGEPAGPAPSSPTIR